MFSSSGPSIPSGDYAILCNYDAALDYLTERETRSHQFGRQEGFIELLRNGDSFEDGRIGIRYHDTHVIVLHQNGDTSFYTGGWHTVSTSNWIRSNPRFDCSLYEPRSGERKPYRYSHIRFTGHDRNIEQKFRDQFGLPSVSEKNWISTYDYEGDFTGEYDANQRPIYTPGDEVMKQRVRDFREAYDAERFRRHPYYVFEEGITFTKRGACPEGRLLSEAIAEERAERAEAAAKRRKTYGAITRYTNRTMKALAEGLPLEDEGPTNNPDLHAIVERAEPSAGLTLRIVSRSLPGDVRSWLNLHERDGQIVMGELPPVIEPIVRRKIGEMLKRTLVTQ